MHISLFTIHIILGLGSCLRPNIVIIVADDLGWNDVGFHSGDVPTPNIDALAYHGVILTRHYSQPVCSPSRTVLFTGNYPFRYGMQGKPCIPGYPDGLKTGVKLMPQYFSKLGYRTHLVGKWHLGYETPQHLPTRRGFHSFFGYLNGYLGYWDGVHYSRGVPGRDFRRNEEEAWREVYGKYLTDLLTQEAVRIIDSHEGEEGLLLIVSEAAVHSTDLPLAKDAPSGVTNTTDRGFLRATAEKLDWSVGEIVSGLDKRGMLNNSVIAFISDNGAPATSPNFKNGGSNWPLRGEKKSVHEGGVRTIAAVWSPLIQNKSRISNDLFHISDWLPTLYAAAGGSAEDLGLEDGINQWSSLAYGEKEARNALVVDINDKYDTEAIIYGRWKLAKNYAKTSDLKYSDNYSGENGAWFKYDIDALANCKVSQCLGPIPANYRLLRAKATVKDVCESHSKDCYSTHCLFDLIEDPTECHDLASDRPRIVHELKAFLDDYRSHVIPGKTYKFDNRSSPEHWRDYWSPWMVYDEGSSHFCPNQTKY